MLTWNRTSRLRVVDVVLWMHGKKPKRSFSIAGELGLPAPGAEDS